MLSNLPDVLLVEILAVAGLQATGRVLSTRKLERCTVRAVLRPEGTVRAAGVEAGRGAGRGGGAAEPEARRTVLRSGTKGRPDTSEIRRRLMDSAFP